MASVFVIGAGGVGKSTLIGAYAQESGSKAVIIKELARDLMKESAIHQEDLANDHVFWKLQVGILLLQINREEELEGQHFVSDRSGLHPLIYAALLKPHLFPLLTNDNKTHSTPGKVEELFTPLLIH